MRSRLISIAVAGVLLASAASAVPGIDRAIPSAPSADIAAMPLGEFYRVTRFDGDRARLERIGAALVVATLTKGKGCPALSRVDPAIVVMLFRRERLIWMWRAAMFRSGEDPAEASQPMWKYWLSYVAEWCRDPAFDLRRTLSH